MQLDGAYHAVPRWRRRGVWNILRSDCFDPAFDPHGLLKHCLTSSTLGKTHPLLIESEVTYNAGRQISKVQETSTISDGQQRDEVLLF